MECRSMKKEKKKKSDAVRKLYIIIFRVAANSACGGAAIRFYVFFINRASGSQCDCSRRSTRNAMTQ